MSLAEIVRPYGDTTGDGRVQLSFTLPVPFGDETERARAEGAALQLAAKMGMDPAMVVHAKGMGPDFTFFIVYGKVSHLVDLSAVTVTERDRQRERQLHPPVPGGVTVGAHDSGEAHGVTSSISVAGL